MSLWKIILGAWLISDSKDAPVRKLGRIILNIFLFIVFLPILLISNGCNGSRNYSNTTTSYNTVREDTPEEIEFKRKKQEEELRIKQELEQDRLQRQKEEDMRIREGLGEDPNIPIKNDEERAFLRKISDNISYLKPEEAYARAVYNGFKYPKDKIGVFAHIGEYALYGIVDNTKGKLEFTEIDINNKVQHKKIMSCNYFIVSKEYINFVFNNLKKTKPNEYKSIMKHLFENEMINVVKDPIGYYLLNMFHLVKGEVVIGDYELIRLEVTKKN